MTYTLYGWATTSTFAPEATLAELAVPFEFVAVDTSKGAHREKDFRAINPVGKVPALILPDGSVITESAAMLLHLADLHPEAGLLPGLGTPGRAQAYRWLFFLVTSLYEPDLRAAYGERYSVDPRGAEGVRAAAIKMAEESWGHLDQTLREGPYLLGKDFSVVDIYAVMFAGWHDDPPGLFQRFPRVKALVEAVRHRPRLAPVWKKHFGYQAAYR